MELKKNPKADLLNKRTLFLELGLAASLGFVILIFAYSQPEKIIEIPPVEVAVFDEEIIEITRQDRRMQQPVQKQIAVVAEVIKIVADDTKIESEIVFTDFIEDAIVVAEVTVGPEDYYEDDDNIYQIVEKMPQFQGGDETKFAAWVNSKIGDNYPEEARRNNIQGRVIVQFVVRKDGTVDMIEVVNAAAVDKILQDAVVNVIKTSPKWTPGEQRGKPVNIRFQQQFTFRLRN